MKLNIQLFAEEITADTPVANNEATITTTDNGGATTETKQPTFTELLKNPEYQREFDKLVDKSLNTAKSKWEADYNARLQAEKSEAEKLAQMDATQKINYQLEKTNAENEELKNQLNAINLYKTATQIAGEKELPNGYLELIDFKQETAESLSSKIDKLVELRQKDLESYLNNKLKQPTPQEKKTQTKALDPYVVGFLSEI